MGLRPMPESASESESLTEMLLLQFFDGVSIPDTFTNSNCLREKSLGLFDYKQILGEVTRKIECFACENGSILIIRVKSDTVSVCMS